MESQVQFRVSEDAKQLAHKASKRNGRKLSDTLRTVVEALAEEQRQYESNDHWITEQVNEAFARVDRGEATLYTNEHVEDVMAAKKAKYRGK